MACLSPVLETTTESRMRLVGWSLLLLSLLLWLLGSRINWDEPEATFRRESFTLSHPPCAPQCGPERPYEGANHE